MNRLLSNLETSWPRCVVAGAIAWVFLVIFPTTTTTAQDRPNARNLGAPSPAEMLVRLQYRRQQETPLFDLLRSSGRDIFSKMGDDERKFAERFAEDLIQKRGMDSDEVKELMNQMNVGPELQKAIGESFKDADLNKLRQQLENRGQSNSASKSNFDLERLKNRLEKVRQQQVRNKLSNNSRSDVGDSGDSNPSQTLLDAISKLKSSNANGNNAPGSNSPSKNGGRRSAFDNARGDQLNKDLPRDKAGTKQANGNTNPKATNRSNPPVRNQRRPKLGAAPVIDDDLGNIFGDNAFTPETRIEDRPPSSDQRSNSSSRSNDSSSVSPLLDKSQRRVVEKLQSAITPNTTRGRETRRSLEQLKQSKDPTEFLDQLKKLSRQVESDERKQKLLENAAQRLSKSDENMIQSFVEPFSPELAKSLRGTPSNQDDQGSENQNPNGTGREGVSSAQPEDWAQSEFLKKAISYYNDEESGFQKPKGFDRLLNENGNRRGGGTMNFEAAKKLWNQSSNIFDDKNAESGNSKKVKPGQRIDQSVIEAIKKVSSSDSDSSAEQKSMFSNALNGLIGTAMGKAEDSAQKKVDRQRARERARDQAGWTPGNSRQSPQNSRNNQSSMAQTLQNLGSTSSRNNDRSNSNLPASTPTLPTMPDVSSSVGPLIYALVVILLAGAFIYLAVWMQKPIDEVANKQKQLQKKLQSGSTSNPSDIVEAVDLLLLAKFGSASSWWNSHRAAEQLQSAKPGWHEKIGSVFQVYRWSRYQASDESKISTDQESIVTNVLKELADEPESVFRSAATKESRLPEDQTDYQSEPHSNASADRSEATS